ncbi:Target of rapamycin complex 1 subunit kog1 [Tieghemiomyces parasiticus]|uniref:Target of rapamycin complex 1 subunit kog1 n=1 Tax=Tieghemiomyces parasiticus TaxID=78921 RepID=A0A9W8A4Y0_9FUNG|nr:Target of rapamycin complex 1 subunit kog1 [Tieghemiomyces parasiticus]
MASASLSAHMTPPGSTSRRPKSSQKPRDQPNIWDPRPIGAPTAARNKDTEVLPMEEPTYVDNYLTTRRFRHPFVSLDRSFRLFDWRLTDKTPAYGAILAVCLRIGIDPPDIIKPLVCAKLEAWIDPFAEPAHQALSRIGQNLQKQYEFLNQNLKYRLLMDPTIEDTKRQTIVMRRSAKGSRVLFHYNGHGVPMPTKNGDIWVFNSNYTQYMPVSVQDIQIWLGSPGIFVYDCSAAGNILEAFVKHAKRKDLEWLAAVCAQEERSIHGQSPADTGTAPPPASSSSSSTRNGGSSSRVPPLASLPHSHSVHFAACRGEEQLPTSPNLPADVFTTCMTTPVEMAMRWWIMRNNHLTDFNQSAAAMVPGFVNSRRSALGEIHWIFTAITDTIAWNVLPREAFKKLFRHDLLISTLFRNFMFASRLMRAYGCHPMSYPELPPTHDHPLWEAFEYALDECLTQLPAFIAASQHNIHYEFVPSDFFTFQLDSFEAYLSQGAPRQAHPELLPIILQVLLSQLHRNRALRLLAEFLRFGRWAVDQCLAVGIFPYILKLIGSSQTNSRGYLSAIWAAIISVDYSVRQELLRTNTLGYFVEVLMEDNLNLLENSALAVLACRVHGLMVLTHLCRDLPEAQDAFERFDTLFPHFKVLLAPARTTPVRQWTCLLMAELCRNHVANVDRVLRHDLHATLIALLEDPIPEVRAAAASALGALLGPADRTEHVANVELVIAVALTDRTQDASPIVRKELLIALSRYVKRYPERFFVLAMEDTVKRQREGRLAGSKRGALPAHFTRAGARRTQSTIGTPGAGGFAYTTERRETMAVIRPEVAQALAVLAAVPRPEQASGRDDTHDDDPAAVLAGALPELLCAADQVPHEMGLAVWRTLIRLSADPVAEVAQLAAMVLDFVLQPLMATVEVVSETLATHGGNTPVEFGAPTPRPRSVSHHLSLSSPTHGATSPTSPGRTSSLGRHSSTDAAAATLEALTHAATKYGHEAAGGAQDAYSRSESGNSSLSSSVTTTASLPTRNVAPRTRTHPPTPTRGRTAEPVGITAKLTKSLKRSASSTINLMYNLAAGSGTAIDSSADPPPLTPTPAQMRFQMVRSNNHSPPTPGTETFAGSQGLAAVNRQSAVYSYEDPSLRSLDSQLAADLSGLGLRDESATAAGTPHAAPFTHTGGHLPPLPAGLSLDVLLEILARLPVFPPPIELPLVSKFLEWQTLLATEPYLRKPEEQQEGSEQYLASAWRKSRNDNVVTSFEAARAHYTDRTRWFKQHHMAVNFVPYLLTFHRYEPQLILSDGLQNVSIYDHQSQTRLHTLHITSMLNGAIPPLSAAAGPPVPPANTAASSATHTAASTPGAGGREPAAAASYFFSGHHTGTAAAASQSSGVAALLLPQQPRITTLQVINEMDYGLLMVGTHDGTLRFFQNYTDRERCEMVTGWQNFAEPTHDRRRPSRLLTAWVQKTGRLYVTGSASRINVWDLAQERCVRSIQSKTMGSVCAVTADQYNGHLLYCGGSDGVVRVYDDRQGETPGPVRSFGEPNPYTVVQLGLQVGYTHEFLSASTDGRVRLWDLRAGGLKQSPLAVHGSGVLNHMVVHDNLPIFATAAPSSGSSGSGGGGGGSAVGSGASANLASPSLSSATAGSVSTYSPASHPSSMNGGARPERASNHMVKVWDMNFNNIGHAQRHTGILSQRVAPVTALAIDHFTPTIAMGNDDSTVTFISSTA